MDDQTSSPNSSSSTPNMLNDNQQGTAGASNQGTIGQNSPQNPPQSGVVGSADQEPAAPQSTAAPPPTPINPSAAPSSPQPTPTPPPSATAGTTQTATPSVSDTKPKRSFRRLFVVLGILLVLAGIGFAVWKFWPRGFMGLGKPGEIVWWGLWEEESSVQPLIEEFQNENPNVDITYVKQSPQDYRERLTNSLARGEGPDIFRYHNSWVPMLKSELDAMPSSVMSAEEFSNTFYPTMVSDLTSGTDLVGIPLGYDALTLYINEDIFARAGKTPPATWDDFRQLALELTTKDENGNIVISGAALGRTENVDHWQEIVGLMMMQNGVDLSNPTGQLAQDAIVFYTVFSKVDGVWNETLPPSTVSFANGNVAMYLAPTWRAFEIQQINPDLRFRTVPVPQLPKDNPNEPDITYATYWVEGVWGRSTNREVAWEFLRFLSSRQSLEKMYENASQTRLFGEPYPRSDMADLVSSHPIIGSVIRTAPNAKSWYLADRTRDGETGINSQIASYFEDTVNTASERTLGVEQLNTLSNGISQVLSQYGLLRR